MALAETLILPVTTTPVDLTAHALIDAPAVGDRSEWYYLENTGSRVLYFREGATAAPSANARGHRIRPGGGVVVSLATHYAFWIWAIGTGEVTISNASPWPVRVA